MSIHEEYMRRIYEPYGYLHTKGVSYLDLKKGERIIFFETYEGAIKYFDEYVYHTKYDGTLVLPPKKGVRYVHVEHPGKYTAVNLAVADFSHTLYGNFHIVSKTHPEHGQYVGWAYLQKKNEIDNSNYALNV